MAKDIEEKIYSKDDLKRYFEIQSTIKARADDIARICTNITSHEHITEMWLDDDLFPDTVGIGVWSSECGCDSYHIPIEYFSMTLGEIKKIEKKKAELERIRRLKEEKRMKKDAERAERREYERLKKKFG